MKTRWLSIVLALLAASSIWTALVAADLIPNFGIVGKVRPLAYDLSVGYLISYIFFVLVVVIPDQRASRRTGRLMANHFRTFKLTCIEIYLTAIGDSWDSELPQQLLQPEAFRDYFSAHFSESQNRWHAVHNGLYDYGVPELIIESELLAREIEYTLVKLNIEDEEVEIFLKRLSRSLLRLRNSEPTYDDVKRLLNFLYPIHSHWSWLDGYVGRDPVGEMIARLG